MSPPRWVKDHWWMPLVLATLAAGGWVARVEASLERDTEVLETRTFTVALARLACMKFYTDAKLAGLPCNDLFNGIRRLP